MFFQCALWDRETFSPSKISVSGGLRKMGIFRRIRPSWCCAIELDQQAPRTTGETDCSRTNISDTWKLERAGRKAEALSQTLASISKSPLASSRVAATLCCLRLLASLNPKQSLTLPLVPQLPPHQDLGFQDLTPQYCTGNWSNIKILILVWYLISTILRRRRIISNIIHLNGLAHKMHSTCRKNFRRLSTTHSNVVRFSVHSLSCYCNNKDILFHILRHYHFSLTKNIFLKFKQATPIILPEFFAT